VKPNDALRVAIENTMDNSLNSQTYSAKKIMELFVPRLSSANEVSGMFVAYIEKLLKNDNNNYYKNYISINAEL